MYDGTEIKKRKEKKKKTPPGRRKEYEQRNDSTKDQEQSFLQRTYSPLGE